MRALRFLSGEHYVVQDIPQFVYEKKRLMNCNLFSGTELWCGQSQTKIIIWNLGATGGSFHCVGHYEDEAKPVAAAADVIHLVTGQTSGQCTVWSYVYPGKFSCLLSFRSLKRI
jgi:hypothetical protein